MQLITLPLPVIQNIVHAAKVMSEILDENKDYLSSEDAQRMKYVLRLWKDSRTSIENEMKGKE